MGWLAGRAIIGGTVMVVAISGGVANAQPNRAPAPGLVALVFPTPSVYGGDKTMALVKLSAPAPAGGSVVKLSAKSATYLKVPRSVKIRAGGIYGLFTLKTKVIKRGGTGTVTATLGKSTLKTKMKLRPQPVLKALSLGTTDKRLSKNTLKIAKGGYATGTVTLSAPAPNTGLSVSLATNKGIKIPARVTVPAGALSRTFLIKSSRTTPAKAMVISAVKRRGGEMLMARLQVVNKASGAARVSGLIVPPVLVAGKTVTAGVTLDRPAPKATSVPLRGDNGTMTYPKAVTIPAGAAGATFKVAAKAFSTANSVLTVSGAGGSGSYSAFQLVDALKPIKVDNVGPIAANGTRDLHIYLNRPPVGLVKVALKSGNNLLQVPASVTVGPIGGVAVVRLPAGNHPQGSTFPVTATLNGGAATGTLTLG
jgi:hypothetical protein